MSCLRLILGVFLLMTVVAGSARADVCSDLKPRETRVYVDLIQPEPAFDLSKTAKDLTANRRKVLDDWYAKNGTQVVWQSAATEVAGLASGGSDLRMVFQMYTQKVDSYGATFCPYFDEINIAVFYRTLIFIPTEYKKGSCAFNDILKHEFRHHEANRITVEKYTEILKKDIYAMIAQMEQGYVPKGEVKDRLEEMKKGLQDMLQVYLTEAMAKEMTEQNALIDTPEEYKRMTYAINQCQRIDQEMATKRR